MHELVDLLQRSAAGSALAASKPQLHQMIVEALRTMDDVVIFDPATGVVRQRNRPAQQVAGAAVEATA